MLNTLAIIPARLASTRLPNKPLLTLKGKPLILWVWEGVQKSRLVDRVVVATDHEAIAALIEKNGGEAMMTPEDIPTGSDRVAWVAKRIPSRYVLNVQGDDPLTGPEHIDPLLEALKADSEIKLALLAKEIERAEEITRESVVKMVFDNFGRALYFSRSVIPFPRNPGARYYKHIGPYAWDRDTLLNFASWPQTMLEQSESLEMLRVLERGLQIKCIVTGRDTIEIDTPEDVLLFDSNYQSFIVD